MRRYLYTLGLSVGLFALLFAGCPAGDDDDFNNDDDDASGDDDDATADDDDTTADDDDATADDDDDTTADDDDATADDDDDATADDDDDTGQDVTLGDVQGAVFTASCMGANCHGPQNDAANLSLAPGNSYAALVGVVSTQASPMVRVLPGDTNGSYLWHKVEGTQGSVGGSGQQMPVGGTLDANQLGLIEDWILDGAMP